MNRIEPKTISTTTPSHHPTPPPNKITHCPTNKQIGRAAARRPWRVSAACLLVSVLCGLGLLRVVVETSPQVKMF